MIALMKKIISMFMLPSTTVFNKRIPKQKFYENMDITPALKRVFVEQIKIIYWRNKIAPTTVNMAKGETVTEIEVIEIKLVDRVQPEAVLRQIDKAIPYHIVFLLECGGQYQAWTAYKEASEGANAFKVHSYYHTDWMPEDELPLKLEGLDMDAAYESFVKQIRGSVDAEEWSEELSLAEGVTLDEKRRKLQKEIERLDKLARAETQPRKKFELVSKMKKCKDEMEAVYAGHASD